MSDLRIESDSKDGLTLHLILEGVLDGSGAYLLRERIAEADRPVLVDFSRLQRLSDFGLGILAAGAAERPNSVQFVGLGHHGQRILRAFGLDQAA